MARETISLLHDANNVLTTGEVPPVFQAHWPDMETGKHGIANLIALILKEREAVFPAGVENSEFRSVAIGTSVFASELIEEVQNRFTAGTRRYPYNTIHQYVAVFMDPANKHFKKNLPKVGQIHLTNAEDKNRFTKTGKRIFKPRCKYYLIQE